MSISSVSDLGSPMATASGPSSGPLRTVSDGLPISTSSSELSTLSDEVVKVNGKAKGKKRSSEQPIKPAKPAKKAKIEPEVKERGIYCHQCRTKCEPDAVLRCTRLKQFSKNTPPRACNLAFCDRDLKKRYAVDPAAVRAGTAREEGHEPSAGYCFTCACCLDQCQTSSCRKKKGLEPLGNLVKHRPAASRAGSSSELSDVQSPNHSESRNAASQRRPEGRVAAGQKQAKDAKPMAKKKKVEEKGGTVGKKAAVGKAVKGSTKGREEKAKTPRPKKVEVPVEPPVFPRLETRLSREEAEQRIMIREYLVRFQAILSIPERSLPALDDFDRPLTEGNVRLYAGAMIDLIREGLDEDQKDVVFQPREELRYYADLTRFAKIYDVLSERLHLHLPPAPETGLRALLNLTPAEGPPTWATEYAPRRGASKIPQPSDVVRMLLALAERTLSTPAIRADLDSTAGEYLIQKQHASAVKAENGVWEGSQKKIAGAGVQCSTPAETKANKAKMAKEQKEHDMRLALLNVNLHAALNRRLLRHEPLGVDLDGRVYYVLTIRPMQDRAPTGWASNLLVYGAPPGAGPRWSHFTDSQEVRQLGKWLQWRLRTAVGELRPSTPKKTPKKVETGPRQSLLKFTPSKPSRVEVVIPVTAKKARSMSTSSGSSLSEAPVPRKEELLSLVAPIEFKPSAERVEEEGKELVAKLMEVCEWLEVLEWKAR